MSASIHSVKKYTFVDLHSAVIGDNDHSCRLCNKHSAEKVPQRAM